MPLLAILLLIFLFSCSQPSTYIKDFCVAPAKISISSTPNSLDLNNISCTSETPIPLAILRVAFNPIFISPTTTSLPVTFKIFTSDGRELWSKTESYISGSTIINTFWNLRDKDGEVVPPGLYVATVTLELSNEELKWQYVEVLP